MFLVIMPPIELQKVIMNNETLLLQKPIIKAGDVTRCTDKADFIVQDKSEGIFHSCGDVFNRGHCQSHTCNTNSHSQYGKLCEFSCGLCSNFSCPTSSSVMPRTSIDVGWISMSDQVSSQAGYHGQVRVFTWCPFHELVCMTDEWCGVVRHMSIWKGRKQKQKKDAWMQAGMLLSYGEVAIRLFHCKFIKNTIAGSVCRLYVRMMNACKELAGHNSHVASRWCPPEDRQW